MKISATGTDFFVYVTNSTLNYNRLIVNNIVNMLEVIQNLKYNKYTSNL